MARYLRALLKLRLSHPGGSWWGGGSVRKISATPVQEPIDGPLAGLRVLDLTRSVRARILRWVSDNGVRVPAYDLR